MPQRRTFAPMPMNNPAPQRTGRGAPPAGMSAPPPAQPTPPGGPLLPMQPNAPMMPANLRVPTGVPMAPAAPQMPQPQPLTGSGSGTVNQTTVAPFLAAREGSTMNPQSGGGMPLPHESQTTPNDLDGTDDTEEGGVPQGLLKMLAALRQ